jgi:hypothetical protein
MLLEDDAECTRLRVALVNEPYKVGEVFRLLNKWPSDKPGVMSRCTRLPKGQP